MFWKSTRYIFIIFYPVVFLIHGLFYYRGYSDSLSNLVYFQKSLSLIPFAIGLLNYGLSPFSSFLKSKQFISFYIIAFVIQGMILGIISPIDNFSIFYYISDTIGTISFFGFAIIFYELFKRNAIKINDIFMTLLSSAGLISLGNILCFFLNDYAKVSIPPEIHLAYVLIFVPNKIFSNKNKLQIFINIFKALIIINSFTSTMRIYLFLFILNVILFTIYNYSTLLHDLNRSLLYANYKFKISFLRLVKPILFTLLIFIFIFIITLYKPSLALIESVFNFDVLNAISQQNIESEQGTLDASILYRFTEIILGHNEIMSRNPFYYITGLGFGAQYFNSIAILRGEFLHTIHNTYYCMLFRSGILGLLLLLIPLISSLKDILISFFINHLIEFSFISQLLVITLSLASLSDLYFTYSLSTPIVLSLFLFFSDIKKVNRI